MKKIVFFAIFVFLLAMLTVTASAHSATVYDDADLLTAEEEEKLSAACNCSTEGVRFYVVTAHAQMTNSAVIGRCGIGEDTDAIVLVIDQTNGKYYYEMFTYNRADQWLSDSQADRILDDDDVYSSIKSGEIYQGAGLFLQEAQNELEQSLEAERKREAREPLMIAIIALVVGALAGGGAVLGVFLYYRKKQHGESYPLDRYASLQLTESYDRFVGSYVTRVRVQSNNGGGGGGGRVSGGRRGRR